MNHNRRQFLSQATSFAVSYGLLTRRVVNQPIGRHTFSTSQGKGRMRVILLGTKGGPRVGETNGTKAGRHNPSTLILIDEVPYVIDCGYGCSRQLLAAGVSLDRLRYIFITHHHADHNLEYGALLYNAWITGRPVRVDAYGPAGLEKMTRDFFEYTRFDIEIRIVDEGRPDPRKMIAAHDFAKPGIILQNQDVKISACLVRHPPIKESYAYRFDTSDRSIVISGDTAFAPELSEFARGADVLVHEVMYLPGVEELVKRLPNATRLREHLMAAHTLPAEVGKIAAQAGVKTVVLTHFVPGDDSSITDDQWAADVRKHFAGQIIVGKDLMEI